MQGELEGAHGLLLQYVAGQEEERGEDEDCGFVNELRRDEGVCVWGMKGVCVGRWGLGVRG